MKSVWLFSSIIIPCKGPADQAPNGIDFVHSLFSFQLAFDLLFLWFPLWGFLLFGVSSVDFHFTCALPFCASVFCASLVWQPILVIPEGERLSFHFPQLQARILRKKDSRDGGRSLGLGLRPPNLYKALAGSDDWADWSSHPLGAHDLTPAFPFCGAAAQRRKAAFA